MDKLELQKVANEVRKDIVTAVHAAKAGHPGGSLSAADVFTYLYFEEMNIDPKDPKKADRDRFVLSKGHTAPGLYSVLAERGYFPKEDLKTLRHLGSSSIIKFGRPVRSSASTSLDFSPPESELIRFEAFAPPNRYMPSVFLKSFSTSAGKSS